MKRKQYGLILLLWIFLLFLPGEGAAALFEQLAIETRAASLGNAVTADPQGPMVSVHYNPAGLDRVRGTEVTMGLFYIPVLNVKGKFTQATDPATGKLWAPFGGWFNNGIDPEAGHESSTTGSAELPFLGGSPYGWQRQISGSPITTSEFALRLRYCHLCALRGRHGVHEDENDPYRFLGKRMSILRLVTGPTISYRVAKSLSIGASFGLGMSYMGFDTKMRAPNDLVALTGALGEATVGLEIPIISELTLPAPWFGGGLNPYEEMGGLKFFAEDNLNTSYNVGFLWEPFDWVSFGGVYQSQAKADMKGKYTFELQRPHAENGQLARFVADDDHYRRHARPADLLLRARWRETCRSRSSIPPVPNLASSSSPTPASNSLRTPTGPSGRPGKTWTIVFDRDNELLRLAKLMGYTGGDRKLIMENHFK
ncbi:MAG: outer membrane protein transport protein [Desulfobacterales bacterium]|nr:outer membrane protein transport protein [Desulfobacterales bacterium]